VSGVRLQRSSDSEFTGERVVPGHVNDDLWAEHLSRYAFAYRFAAYTRALDLGCGTGYGAHELARTARHVVGIDPAREAIGYAKRNFASPNSTFLQASALALPFANGAFDLVTAFEVIEHLQDWRALLSEARRVLAPAGVFLVSTPNKLYYAESREFEGPNPYHEHEFEFEEFRSALEEFFPHVAMLLQNRLESVAFYPEQPLPMDTRIDRAEGSPAEANFFVAVCSLGQPAVTRSFLYVPRAANVLREREHHIKLLEQDLRQSIEEHNDLAAKHTELTHHLEDQNRWAADLEFKWREAQDRIVELQEEFEAQQQHATTMAAAYQKTVADLELENQQKTLWAMETERRLSAELVSQSGHFAEVLRKLEASEQLVEERTNWAQGLDEQLRHTEVQLEMVRDSRWIKIGRFFGLGPRIR
jgi:SAM-dependent methyltransferase